MCGIQTAGDTNTAIQTVQVLFPGKIYDGLPGDMMNFSDTIAAISTAPGVGALAVVRISGPDAETVARKIFTPGKKNSVDREKNSDLKSHHATYGFIRDTSGEPLDEVVLTFYKSPHSYTGEDLIEITCHGGPVITNEVLALILSHNVRLARKGEFTERAFLNGRMDLTQAEAVLDLIQAKTLRQGRRALSALAGELGDRIKSVRDELIALLTRIVAGIDFPEEIGDAPEPEVDEVVRRCKIELEQLARTARTGRFLRDGLRLAIVGRPNAGKSSLLNQLLKFERAIVTDIPGTTRDSLEELLDLNGIPIVLVDTAGIRPTQDHVEKIGIERTKKAIVECDLVLFVVDLKEGWDEPEQEILSLLANRFFLLVGNKVDLANFDFSATKAQEHINCVGDVYISARTGENIEHLTAAIEKFVFADQSNKDGPSLNARQGELCLKAASALSLVESTLAQGLPQDCLATDLKTAIDALSEISGEAVSEEIISQVFATFCIGK